MLRILSTALFAAALAWTAPASATGENRHLDILLERLKAVTDAAEAERVELYIWTLWTRYEGSQAQVQTLMGHGMEALARRDFPAAIRAFDKVVALDPDYPEGWNKRATAHYLAGQDEASVSDIKRVLALEPRHFGAMNGLGMIYLRAGQKQAALKSFEAALAVNPHLGSARKHAAALRRMLAGDPA